MSIQQYGPALSIESVVKNLLQHGYTYQNGTELVRVVRYGPVLLRDVYLPNEDYDRLYHWVENQAGTAVRGAVVVATYNLYH